MTVTGPTQEEHEASRLSQRSDVWGKNSLRAYSAIAQWPEAADRRQHSRYAEWLGVENPTK